MFVKIQFLILLYTYTSSAMHERIYSTKGFLVRDKYMVSGTRGCFRDLNEFSRSGLPYLRGLTRSRQFRNEIHGGSIYRRRLRGDLPRGGRSFRGPRLSPKSGYYAIYGLSGWASATLQQRRASRFLREWSGGCYTDLSRIVIRRVYGDHRLLTVLTGYAIPLARVALLELKFFFLHCLALLWNLF